MKYRILTFPSGSGMRKSAAIMDDLPAPVLPAIPIFSLSATEKLMSFKTRGPPLMYLRDILRMVMSPRCGQDEGGQVLVLYPGSASKVVYHITLSTEVM